MANQRGLYSINTCMLGSYFDLVINKLLTTSNIYMLKLLLIILLIFVFTIVLCHSVDYIVHIMYVYYVCVRVYTYIYIYQSDLSCFKIKRYINLLGYLYVKMLPKYTIFDYTCSRLQRKHVVKIFW